MRIELIGLIFSALLLNTCITPIDTDIENRTENLIVDAELTSYPGPYMVELTNSASFNSPPRVTGATVWITDNLNNRLDFLEIEDGVYESDPNSSFRGVVGRTYTLHIETMEGALVESFPETMVPVPPIETMTFRPAERVRISTLGNEIVIRGFQVLLNTRSLGGQGTYLKWDYRGVYVVKTPNPTLRNIPCFITDTAPTEYLNVFGTDTDRSLPILDIPMEFFTPTFKFDTIYFFIAKQFSLNRDAFEFWDAVDRQRNNTGSIFDPPPSTIPNNLINQSNPDEDVLGYFTVSAATESTFQISRLELERFNFQFEVPFPECFRIDRPDFCDSCNLLDDSSILFPEVDW